MSEEKKETQTKKTSEQGSLGGVRKVAPVGDAAGGEDGSYGGSASWFSRLRDTASAAAGTAFHTAKEGFRNLKDQTLRSTGKVVGAGFETVGNFLHISKMAAGVLVTGSLLLTSGAGILAWQNASWMDLVLRQEGTIDDCAEEVAAMRVSSSVGDVSGLALEYAAKAWAVGKAIGMTDEQCAGMLGNMQAESGMDATSIETIYDEPFNINGAKKSAAANDLCAFVTTSMRQKYVSSGMGVSGHTTAAGCTMASAGGSPSLISSAYEGLDGHFYPGLGLFGFTGASASSLAAYAASAGRNWYDFDLQMAFSLDTSGGYGRASWVQSWISSGSKPATPEEAAQQWNVSFEGNAGNFKGDVKGQYARQWYDQFAGTLGDQTYAQSVLALADTIAGGATNNAVASAEDRCADAEAVYDNSSLARAAVSYAYASISLGRGNDGTALYRAVHDAVFPGDTLYQSCDRGVTTAIRWSGYDDHVPAGSTSELDVYFQSTPEHWQMVGVFGQDVMFEDLQPGDILNTTAARRGDANGHIVLYVGNDLVQEKFPGSDACFVSASLNDWSPSCEGWTSGKFYGQGYYVYRNVQRESASIYTDVVAGQNLDDGS